MTTNSIRHGLYGRYHHVADAASIGYLADAFHGTPFPKSPLPQVTQLGVSIQCEFVVPLFPPTPHYMPDHMVFGFPTETPGNAIAIDEIHRLRALAFAAGDGLDLCDRRGIGKQNALA